MVHCWLLILAICVDLVWFALLLPFHSTLRWNQGIKIAIKIKDKDGRFISRKKTYFLPSKTYSRRDCYIFVRLWVLSTGWWIWSVYPSELFNTKNLVDKIETRGRGGRLPLFVTSVCLCGRWLGNERTNECSGGAVGWETENSWAAAGLQLPGRHTTPSIPPNSQLSS